MVRRLLCYTANGSSAGLEAVAVRRVDEGTAEVEVVRVGRNVLSRGPVVAVAALSVEATVPVATALEKTIR